MIGKHFSAIQKVGQEIIRIDPKYYRPTEVETLLGDPRKAKKILNWKPKISFNELVNEMIIKDYQDQLKKISLK